MVSFSSNIRRLSTETASNITRACGFLLLKTLMNRAVILRNFLLQLGYIYNILMVRVITIPKIIKVGLL